MNKGIPMLSAGIGSYFFYDHYLKVQILPNEDFKSFFKRMFQNKFVDNKEQTTTLSNKPENEIVKSNYSKYLPGYIPLFSIPIETILKNKKNLGIFLLTALAYIKKDKLRGYMYVSKNDLKANISSVKSSIRSKFEKTKTQLSVIMKQIINIRKNLNFLTGEVKKTKKTVNEIKSDTEDLKEKTKNIENTTTEIKKDTNKIIQQNKDIKHTVESFEGVLQENSSGIKQLKQYLAPNVFEEEPPKRELENQSEKAEEIQENNPEQTQENEKISPVSNSDSSASFSSTAELVNHPSDTENNDNNDNDDNDDENNNNSYSSWIPKLNLSSITK